MTNNVIYLKHQATAKQNNAQILPTAPFRILYISTQPRLQLDQDSAISQVLHGALTDSHGGKALTLCYLFSASPARPKISATQLKYNKKYTLNY